jgi:hypothetical protein
MSNGDAAISANQCDQRMAGVRKEMETSFNQVRTDLKDLGGKIDLLKSEFHQNIADCFKAAASEKLAAAKICADDKAAETKVIADEKLARTLKDKILEHRIEILLILILVAVGGGNAMTFVRGLF